MPSIRRRDREITPKEAARIFEAAEYGVLSTVDEEGQPYGVPLSFVYKNGSIYFHCALEGHKLVNLAGQPRVSFCAVGRTKLLPDQFATEYESAVAFGVATEAEGAERHAALVWLLEKYCPNFIAEGERYIEAKDRATKVIKIAVGRISGKARR